MKIDLVLFLAALSSVESSNNDLAVGAAGEVSRYQISPLVWRAYAQPNENPTNANHAKIVALRYINSELTNRLSDHFDEHDQVRTLAAMWNYGPKAVGTVWPSSVAKFANNVSARYFTRRVRSVEPAHLVASMRIDSLRDGDGVEIAKKVYLNLFSDGKAVFMPQ